MTSEVPASEVVSAVTHSDKRLNIPTSDAAAFVTADIAGPKVLRYPRDTALDPQLVWKGKDALDDEDLTVVAPPIFINEKLDPRVLINDLMRRAEQGVDSEALSLFDSFDGLEAMETIDFYKHAANWSNRLILGDGLQVMCSLAEREQLRGQVQMIYLDPPYGIKFGSNWQASTRRLDVKDRLEDATREVEQIKAFRDTWELGIHSYLSYMRDRLVAARDLLTQSGSVFVQIGEENVHLVRNLLDEVFGSENFVALIPFRKKTMPFGTLFVEQMADFIIWYAKAKTNSTGARVAKYRKLYRTEASTLGFNQVELSDGRRLSLSAAKREFGVLPEGAKLWTSKSLEPSGVMQSGRFRPWFQGKQYDHPKNGYGTDEDGMKRLAVAGRLVPAGSLLRYVLYADDKSLGDLTIPWSDTVGADEKAYVVQTNTEVVKRCMLMCTDPGDLVLDPTCGSGTTAYVAEQWGRRWITIDTSRVAVTITRQRIMAGRFPRYLLADSVDGQAKEGGLSGAAPLSFSVSNDVRKGFVYRRVPHVTMRSIAQNPHITEGMNREECDAAITRTAETVILYNQPYESRHGVRVAGPFTVESLSPHRAFDDEAGLPASQSGSDDESAFVQMLLENLAKAGVQNGRRAERFEFDEVERLPGKFLTARAVPTGDLTEQRVAVSVGPRYGTVGSDWIKAAAREAMKGQGHDVLLVLGFAFDPRALGTVEEFQPDDSQFAVQAEHQAGTIRILLVRMNADLAMGESLLKKTKAANLFTVFGEPDVSAPEWTDDGWVVSIRGFDVYNPVTGEVRAGTENDIAMWMLDTDYDEESFFVRHAYFLGTDPYARLKKALKADIDPEAWESLNSATSRPFPHPSTGKVAVKVINHYGDELLTVLDLPTPPKG